MNCPYCGGSVKLIDSQIIYGKSYGLAWVCENYPKCDAYVGCHPGTDKPLGRLADKELRAWKGAAHAAFDPMWKSRKMTRRRAYQWLSGQIGILEDETHIGMFDADMCKRTVDICREWGR